jgi:hypothetical protein
MKEAKEKYSLFSAGYRIETIAVSREVKKLRDNFYVSIASTNNWPQVRRQLFR